MTGATADENKAIATRLREEVWNRGHLAVADELIAPDCVDHAAPPGHPAGGPAGIKQASAMYRRAFPDLAMTVDDLLAEGDRVATRWTMRGTHRGPFMGQPPTGKAVEVTGIEIVRIAGRQIVEHWVSADQLGLLQQLGLLPPPGQPGR
jgi:steroid delta-isomerase-like uncharacterized protein